MPAAVVTLPANQNTLAGIVELCGGGLVVVMAE